MTTASSFTIYFSFASALEACSRRCPIQIHIYFANIRISVNSGEAICTQFGTEMQDGGRLQLHSTARRLSAYSVVESIATTTTSS